MGQLANRVEDVKAVLVVVGGDEPGRRLRLTGAPSVIGSASGVQERLRDGHVAAAHAEVRLEGGQWLVRDLGSPDGTFVNDVRVDEYVLREGDRLRVGRTILKLLASGDLETRSAEEGFRATVEDGLTLAKSRAAFDDALAREVNRARRYGQPLSLVAVDVDGFRRLNETRGEAVGDLVLQRLTRRFEALLRRRDVLARLDDDEFAAILPGVEATEAEEVAERLCRAAESEEVQTDRGAVKVTVSAGFARLRSKEDARALAERAQKALLRAREAGGNRVEDASPWMPGEAEKSAAAAHHRA